MKPIWVVVVWNCIGCGEINCIKTDVESKERVPLPPERLCEYNEHNECKRTLKENCDNGKVHFFYGFNEEKEETAARI